MSVGVYRLLRLTYHSLHIQSANVLTRDGDPGIINTRVSDADLNCFIFPMNLLEVHGADTFALYYSSISVVMLTSTDIQHQS